MSFRALMLSKTDAAPKSEIVSLKDDDLMEGDVVVDVACSSLNYKDALALTGAAPIVRHWPMIPGIDFAGRVSASDHADFKKGDRIVLNGFGVGEAHYGGYAQKARVKGDWLVKLPERLSEEHAMMIGTAGYTAMLCIIALERFGLAKKSDVLVTGAAGGVGSVAVMLLAALGHRVIASSGRAEKEGGWLKTLGADEVIARAEFEAQGKPIARERFAAAIDVAGSHTLANVLAATRYGGAVAACGLAQGMDLPASVAPFILRNVALLGIDSVMTPLALRREAWARLGKMLDLERLASLAQHVNLSDLQALAPDMLKGRVRGRCVVDVGA